MIKSVDPSGFVGYLACITVTDDETDVEVQIDLEAHEIVPLVAELMLLLKIHNEKENEKR